jgi:phosphate-selective porin OprO/OprP
MTIARADELALSDSSESTPSATLPVSLAPDPAISAVEPLDCPACDVEPKPQQPSEDLSFKTSWKNGFEAQTANKKFRFHVGGRLQLDSVFLDADNEVSAPLVGTGVSDAFSVRRGRIRIDGTMYEFIDWVLEYDFSNSINDNLGLIGGLPSQPPTQENVIGVPAPTELWVAFNKIPYAGTIRAGIHKEPIGFEHLTSSRFLDFLERSFLQDLYFGFLNNGFSPGISMTNTYFDQRGTWTIGVYRNTNNPFQYSVGDGELAGTARVTFAPIQIDRGRRLVHFGLAASTRDPDEGISRFRTRGSLRNGPGAFVSLLADSGLVPATQVNIAAVEAVFQRGPALLQAEYVSSWAHNAQASAADPPIGDYHTQGFYVESLYFLTGEHRDYDPTRGFFDRVVPKRNLFLKDENGCRRGLGGWQVGARYSYADLNDRAIEGGALQDVTIGLNWFLNPNMKLQFNYVIADRNAPAANGPNADGIIHGFGSRLAWDF